jgi:hypothetical protein
MNATSKNTRGTVMNIQRNPSEQIASALFTVPERSMRTHLLVEKLCELEPDEVAKLLQAIIAGAAERNGNHCLLFEALDVSVLTRRAGNSFMSDVYVCAQRSGFEELVRLLSRPDSSRVFNNVGESSADEIPSGVRVAMAKSGNRDQLTRMFSDTNPQVIRTLLKNPSLTESDLLKLASKRPAVADVQREVFLSRKWSARYAVKKALILNPYTPTEIGVKIVHTLMVQDLRLVVESRDLHPWIRETASQYMDNASAKSAADY